MLLLLVSLTKAAPGCAAAARASSAAARSLKSIARAPRGSCGPLAKLMPADAAACHAACGLGRRLAPWLALYILLLATAAPVARAQRRDQLRDHPIAAGGGGAPVSLDGLWVATNDQSKLTVNSTVPGDIITDLQVGRSSPPLRPRQRSRLPATPRPRTTPPHRSYV